MATTTTTTNTKQTEKKELGCMWRRESQNTKEKYLSGVLSVDQLQKAIDASAGAESIQIVVFTNKVKSKDTHPDLRIYLSEKRVAASPMPKAATKPSAAAPAPTPVASADPNPDELI
jgi:hypothetical protein